VSFGEDLGQELWQEKSGNILIVVYRIKLPDFSHHDSYPKHLACLSPFLYSTFFVGSSSGIGQEAAIIFGKEGASVTIHGQSAERLKVFLVFSKIFINHLLFRKLKSY
jgi:hypothetical protein